MRRFLRWVFDWRNGATLLASVLVALLVLSYIDGVNARNDAFEQLTLSRQAASRRIDLLTERITELERRGEENGALIAELRAEQAVLIEQLRRAGEEPVVAVDREPSRPSTSTTSTTAPTRPPPSTTTTTTAPPDDPPPCRIPIPLLCGGRP